MNDVIKTLAEWTGLHKQVNSTSYSSRQAGLCNFKAVDLYSGGGRFKSQLKHWLFLLMFLWFSEVFVGRCRIVP
jgi:hypothetical protein